MATRKPLVVVGGQVQELPLGDALFVTTVGTGDMSNAAASTTFVTNLVGRALVKDVGSGGTTLLNEQEAANSLITVTGALTSNAILEVPASVYRTYVVSNQTTGAFSLSVKQASAAPVAGVARGKRNIVVAVGNGVYDALTDYESIVMTGIPLAPTMPTSADGFEVANTAFVKAAIAAAPAPVATVVEKKFYFHTANTSLTVPAGISTIRFYAGGKGGNGATRAATTGLSGGGGGGGFAFGDLAVAPGDTVAVSISAGVVTVSLNGATVATANPGGIGATGGPGTTGGVAGGVGGTATISGGVTAGGAYSGGAGGGAQGSGTVYTGGGGGSCGSPLGSGFPGGFLNIGATSAGSAGGGIGGAGMSGVGGGGGGAGEAGTATYGGGSTSDGSIRGIVEWFSDPLLRHVVSGRSTVAGATPQPGAGGFGGPGGDFGGGAGGPSGGAVTVGYAGGFLGGGGGNGGTNTMLRSGGAGGYGGGGGGLTGGTAPSTGGAGGAAFCFLYY